MIFEALCRANKNLTGTKMGSQPDHHGPKKFGRYHADEDVRFGDRECIIRRYPQRIRKAKPRQKMEIFAVTTKFFRSLGAVGPQRNFMGAPAGKRQCKCSSPCARTQDSNATHAGSFPGFGD